MNSQHTISRRQFLLSSAVASAGLILPGTALAGKGKGVASGIEPPALKGKSAFSMWQIPSHNNTIGNSYVFRTRSWMDSIGIREHHASCLEGLWRLD
jgi:hypothetical protein